MKKEIIKELAKNFEEFSHEKDGVEFWFARDLQNLLGYARWENFQKVIEKAKTACRNTNQDVYNHFLDITKMVPLGSGGQREIDDLMLTRYACYLIAQNGDPSKEQVAFAMSYFAVQTRRQEVLEKRINDWERVQAREKLSLSEKKLSGIIYERGVDNAGFARIRSKGDQALFGGYSTLEMKKKFGVTDNKPLADFLPAITIKAKDFATEITNFNIKRDDIYGESNITAEHIKNNADVRNVLSKSGIKPESLPPESDIAKVKRSMASEDKHLLKDTKSFSELSDDLFNDDSE